MPAFTPFLNLYKPGGGSTGLITPDEVVDVDRLNQDFDIIDTFAAGWGQAANRNHQFYGPAAALGAVAGMKLGDEYQETDGDKRVFRYDGATWKLWDQTETTWACTITAGAGTGTPTIVAKYRIAGGLLHFRVKITLTGANFGSAPSLSLPADPADPADPDGAFSGWYYAVDASAGQIFEGLVRVTTVLTPYPIATGAALAITATSPFTWANTDTLTLVGSYPV